MAKPALLNHRKFVTAVRLLKVRKSQVLGCLELLYLNAHSSGRPEFTDAQELEAVADWPGPKGKLAKVLREVRLVDRGRGQELVLHDYWEHCPRYVKRRCTTPPEQRLSDGRATSPDGQQMAAPSPIRSDPFPREGVTSRSRSDSEPGSRSAISSSPEGRGTKPETAKDGPQSVSDLLSGLQVGAGPAVSGVRGGAGRRDYGALSADDLIEISAGLERKHSPESALKIWRSRAREIISVRGGLEHWRKVICEVERCGSPLFRDAGPAKKNKAAFVNASTRQFIKDHTAGVKVL